MSKAKFKRRGKASQLPDGGVIALCCGHDFFRAFSGGEAHLTQRTLDQMRSAWRDPSVREAVRQRQQGRHGNTISFAEIAFGPSGQKRLTPDQVTPTREKYLQQQQAIKP